jgi:hypothetical protein
VKGAAAHFAFPAYSSHFIAPGLSAPLRNLDIYDRCLFFYFPSVSISSPPVVVNLSLHLSAISYGVKGEVRVTLCREDIWGSGGIAPPFLNSALDGGEWSVSRSSRFTPGERVPSSHSIGGWVGLRSGPDAVAYRKMSCPYRGSNPGSPVRSPSLNRLNYPGSI